MDDCAARELLQDPTHHTAVIAGNDMMALGVLHECRARGVAVPRDFSVIGFDDIVLAALSYPTLTTDQPVAAGAGASGG